MEEKRQALLSNLKLQTVPPEKRATVEEQKQVLLSIPLRFKTTPEEAEPLAAAFAAARDKAAAEKAAQDAARALAWSKLSDAERREAEALAAIEDEEVAESERRNLKKAQSASVVRGPTESNAAPAAAHQTFRRKSMVPSTSRGLPGAAEGAAESAPAPADSGSSDPKISDTQSRLSVLPQAVRDAIAQKTHAADSEASRAGAGPGLNREADDCRDQGAQGLERGDAADANGSSQPPLEAAAAASSTSRINIQGVFIKSKSDSFVALSKSERSETLPQPHVCCT
jgi:hypothetical protein